MSEKRFSIYTPQRVGKSLTEPPETTQVSCRPESEVVVISDAALEGWQHVNTHPDPDIKGYLEIDFERGRTHMQRLDLILQRTAQITDYANKSTDAEMYIEPRQGKHYGTRINSPEFANPIIVWMKIGEYSEGPANLSPREPEQPSSHNVMGGHYESVSDYDTALFFVNARKMVLELASTIDDMAIEIGRLRETQRKTTGKILFGGDR